MVPLHALRIGLRRLSLAAAGFAATALAQPAPEVDCLGDAAQALQQVNAARSQGALCGARGRFDGAGEVEWNEQLREMALLQARFLVEVEDLRHVGPEGRGVADRAQLVGYRYSRVAENLALGSRTVDDVLRAWTASESHCASLYDARFTEIALVCLRTKGTRPLWVMVLGRPRLQPMP